MTSLFRRFAWWLQRRRKEDELREELRFHLEEEAGEREAGGLSRDEAARAARRDLGNVTLLREDARTLWSPLWVEQLTQDLRYGIRAMRANRLFTALAALSLALGIGANTAIYSFMDGILLRALPVPDPGSLVVVNWRSKPINFSASREFVLHSIDGSTYPDRSGVTAAIFPYGAFERLREVAPPVLSTIFAYMPAGNVNVLINGEADLARGQYVSDAFFGGLAVPPASGRLIVAGDDHPAAPLVAVISAGYSQRRFGGAAEAAGRQILINNISFTVVGVTSSGFFGVDPGAAIDVYLPLHVQLLFDPEAGRMRNDPNFYWIQMMGRVRAGVSRDEAQAVLGSAFEQWVTPTASNDAERANLPRLRLDDGAGGLDSLRRQYAKPLYVLLAMVGLILAIACANTANLLLARAAARTREMAVRLSLGAGRWRIVRQLLTESVLLACISGALGIAFGVAGIRLLTRLLANGEDSFTLHAELNWHVLAATLGLSLLCGILFGLAPAIQATRPALMPALRDRASAGSRMRVTARLPRLGLTHALVVAQIAISLLLLVGAGLFLRTLSNLQSISLGFNRESMLLFEVNAPQSGYPQARAAALYADLRKQLSELAGVRTATLSHASLIRAGRGHPISVNGRRTQGTRVLITGPRFFTTMQIPILRGREILDSDRPGAPRVAVVSELFAKTNFGDEDPVGRRIEIGGSMQVDGAPISVEIVGVAATARYGGLKYQIPPVVYLSHAAIPPSQMHGMTYALRTEGDPLRQLAAVRRIVREADTRVPVTNIRTQAADIDQTINQEIVFARLCSAFAILALLIAGVGLYATMAYAVARRTSEIGLRIALGAGRRTVVWMVLRDVCVLTAIGLAAGVPAALGSSRLIESFLFGMKSNDPRAIALAVFVLAASAFIAAYPPARRASRVDPMIALRHE